MEGMDIRRMQECDLPAVLAIQADLSFQTWTSGHFKTEILDVNYSMPWVLNSDTIEAYVVFKILGDEAELCSIATRRSAQRKGCAFYLLQKALAELQSRGVVREFLEVRRSNQSAQALYRKCGFGECGMRRKYYPDGEDALVMVRDHASHEL